MMGNRDITVSVASCRVHPWHLQPYTTESRFNELRSAFEAGDQSYSPVLAVIDEGEFVIFRGWDQVEVRRAIGEKRIAVNVNANWQVEDIISLGFFDAVAIYKAHDVDVAEQLQIIKRKSKLSNLALAGIWNRDESYVSRILKLNRLVPELAVLFKEGRITKTQAKRFATVSVSEQQRYAKEILSGHLNRRDIAHRFMPPKPVLNAGAAEPKATELDATYIEKSSDIKRYEVWLSETLGCPVEFRRLKSCGGGEMLCRFYSSSEMEGILSKLVFPADEVKVELLVSSGVVGYMVIPYSNLDMLSAMVPAESY